MTVPETLILSQGTASCLTCRVAIRSAFGPTLRKFVAAHTHAEPGPYADALDAICPVPAFPQVERGDDGPKEAVVVNLVAALRGAVEAAKARRVQSVQHDHREPVKGCPRCDLSADEVVR